MYEQNGWWKKKSILKNLKFKTAEIKTTSDDEFSGKLWLISVLSGFI